MKIQLPTGNTMNISAYEFFFLVKEDEVDLFFQACIADDLGSYIDNPFSDKASHGKLEIDEDEPEELRF